MRALRALDGVFLFYLGCVAFRLLAQAVVAFGFLTGGVVYYLGGQKLAPYVMAIGNYASIARDSLATMLVVAALFVGLVAYLARRKPAAPSRAPVAVTLVLAAACALAVMADWRYGVTPLARLFPETESPLAASPPALVLGVRDFMHLRDAQVGMLGEVTGVLEYHERMHRFALRDVEQRESINVYFHRGGRSPFDESFGPPQPPRYYADVAPYVGHTVRVKGTFSRGQVDVDVRDIVALDGAAAVSK